MCNLSFSFHVSSSFIHYKHPCIYLFNRSYRLVHLRSHPSYPSSFFVMYSKVTKSKGLATTRIMNALPNFEEGWQECPPLDLLTVLISAIHQQYQQQQCQLQLPAYRYRRELPSFLSLCHGLTDLVLRVSNRKPKNARSKRALKAREPKLKESAKNAIFVKGQSTSEAVKVALKELVRIPFSFLMHAVFLNFLDIY